jgi:uncharacterized OB-fold protein
VSTTSADAANAPGAPSGRERPLINLDNQYFWDGIAEGRLLVQRCDDCSTLRHPSRPMCGNCQSFRWTPVESSGRGTVYSFVVVHHPPIRGFTPPYAVVLVEFEEGFRVVMSADEVQLDELRIGVPVVFTTCRDGDFSYPSVRLAGEPSTGGVR